MESSKIAQNILAIECSVGRGSVVVIRDGDVVCATDDNSSPSRAEEILRVIDDGLTGAGITLGQLGSIAVSTGPGSYSGIRIGLSTAAGLTDSLSIPCFGVSVLDAMAYHAQEVQSVMTAVPVGKRDVAHCSYELRSQGVTPLSAPVLQSVDEFVATLDASSTRRVFCHNDLFKRLSDKLPPGIEMVDAGTNLATFVGLLAQDRPEKTSMTPIYLRNQKFAGNSTGF